MFRIATVFNRARCAVIASNVLLKQRSCFVRPLSTSTICRADDAFKKSEDHDVDALFNADSDQAANASNRTRRFSSNINRIELLGGVADSPLERTTRAGKGYLTFNMFTNVEFRKANGGFDENVELHNIIVFGNNVPYVRKNVQRGSRVIVVGRLHYSGSGQIGLAGQIPRSASIIADVVQVIAKTNPGQPNKGESQH